eukprot:652212-Alexandrium_andersonii.AAC.1
MASRSCATSASSLATLSSWPVVRLAADGAEDEAGVVDGVMGPSTGGAMAPNCMSASMPTVASAESQSIRVRCPLRGCCPKGEGPLLPVSGSTALAHPGRC